MAPPAQACWPPTWPCNACPRTSWARLQIHFGLERRQLAAFVAIVAVLAAAQAPLVSSQSATATASPALSSCYVTSLAGTGSAGGSGDGGDARQAQVAYPAGIVFLPSGDLLIAEQGGARVRIVYASNGTIDTWAGTGSSGFSGDGGPARAAQLSGPAGLALLPDGGGAALIAEYYNNRVRVVWPNGAIFTWMGTGVGSSTGDGGHRLAATCSSAWKVDADPRTGRVYVAEGGRIRQVEPSGIVSTLVGTSGATVALGGITPVQVLPLPSATGDTMLVPEQGGHRVYLLNVTQRSATVFAGTGSATIGADGVPATSSATWRACNVALHGPSGTVVIVENGANRLRIVNASTGIITTLLGTGAGSSTGDGGHPSTATTNAPAHVLWAPNGALVLSEYYGCRVRLISAGCFSVPSPVSVLSSAMHSDRCHSARMCQSWGLPGNHASICRLLAASHHSGHTPAS